MKIVGCFWTWQNVVFWVCFFWGFNVIVVCFWCVWHSSRSVKNACFSQLFGAFVGWFILVYLGFGRFRCFCVSCVCFCFFVLLLFLFCSLCFCFVVGLFFWCCFFCFCFGFFFFFCFFCSCFFCFCFCFFFLGGFKGQVRWPKGPPHLALNPPYFFVFVFFVVLIFLRV